MFSGRAHEDHGDENKPFDQASTIPTFEDKVDFRRDVLLGYKEKEKLVKIVRILMD